MKPHDFLRADADSPRGNGRAFPGFLPSGIAMARKWLAEFRGTLLAKFQQLYDIEDRGKTLSAGQRLQLRQGESTTVWASLDEC